MKKRFIFLAMCIATILSANAQTSVWDGSHTIWTKGDGTQTNPFLIENAAHLAHLAYIVNNSSGSEIIIGTNTYWKLTTDIDLNGSEDFQWIPIGIHYFFGGNFDGNNHTIRNLFINTTTLNNIGLFGRTYGASIKGIGIIGNSSMTISYGSSAGGIIGYANGTIIDNCYNTGNISFITYESSPSSDFHSGGIVGGVSEDGVTITNCYNTGEISSSYYNYLSQRYSIAGRSYSGGIIGDGYNGATITINNCHNTGDISASSAGGIVGGFYCTTINNSYNTGYISSIDYSGGIIGYNAGATINNSYNTGDISSTKNPGGIGGVMSSGSINNCYNTGSISGGGGIVGNAFRGTINNCYNTGAVGNSGGGIIYTGSLDVANNNYYLVTGGGKYTYGGESKTEDFMKSAEFVSLLNSGVNANSAYTQDLASFINNGFPILKWQTNQPTDVIETSLALPLYVYPNPTKDYLFIQFDYTIGKVEIYNQSGVCVLKNSNFTKMIDVSNLPNGFYLVRINVDGIAMTKKIIIKK